MKKTDVVIIGAGPAGLSAAIECKKHDVDVIVVDEFPKPGGRMLGQLHQEPDGEWWNGIKETEILMDKANQLHTPIKCGVAVHHIETLADGGYVVHTNQDKFTAKNVLIATGAAEVAAPIPGWTLPGVMSIGAAQVMTNVHRVKVGEKGIVVGVNVLSAAIARELQLAGVDLHSMALPAKNAVSEEQAHPQKVMDGLVRIAHLAPSKFIQFGSKFAKNSLVRSIATKFFPKGGVKMWGMPIHVRKAVTKIHGTDNVEAVTMADVTTEGEIIPNTEKRIAVDFVCIAGGLYPLAELAAAIGLPFQYSEELGGHVPLHNEAMETNVDGIYVAGNITGIESAKVARAQGKAAGLSIVKNTTEHNVEAALQNALQEVNETRQAASIQFHPRIEEGRTAISHSFEETATN